MDKKLFSFYGSDISISYLLFHLCPKLPEIGEAFFRLKYLQKIRIPVQLLDDEIGEVGVLLDEINIAAFISGAIMEKALLKTASNRNLLLR